jgi:hypothetical protein
MATWNAAFLSNPKSSDSPSQGDDEIRNLRAAIQERIKNEHTTYDADATGGVPALDWLHKAGSSISYYLPTASEPAVGLSGSPLKAGALWYDTTLDVIKVWTGAAWVIAADNILGTTARAALLQVIVSVLAVSPTIVLTKVLDIGDWNMDSTTLKSVAHGLDATKIRSIKALIRDDAGTSVYDIGNNAGASSYPGGSVAALGATDITLNRLSAGTFDSTTFDATTFNRGWIVVTYVP